MDAPWYARCAPLAAILVFATALQTALWLRLPTVSADGIIFVGLARELAEAPLATFRTEDQHPGYPAMLLVSTRVVQWLGFGGDPESWVAGAMIVSFVCGLATIAVVWLFARDLFDERIASVAAIVYTVLPVPRADAVDAQSDTPHALFYLLAAWMATTGIAGPSFWRLAAAGLASGAAYWIRPEGLEVVLVALPVLAFHAWRAHWPKRQTALALATLAATALVVAAPYGLLAGKLTSKQLQFAKVTPAPTYLEQVATVPVAPQSNGRAADLREPEPPAAAAAEPPVAVPVAPAPPAAEPPPAESRYSLTMVLTVLAAAVSAFVNSICQGFKFVFIPFYLLGNVALAWRRIPTVQIVYLALLGGLHIAVLMGVYVISGYVAHRHVIPLVGLAMPFVALGIFRLGDWLAWPLRVRPAVCTVATLAVCVAIVLPYTLRRLNWEFVPVIEATRWVRAHSDPASGIVSNSPYVEFYGKLPVAMLGPSSPTLEQALAEAPSGASYDYALLHIGAHAYQAEWLDRLKQSYEPVLELPDPIPNDKHRKVLVLRASGDALRQAVREPR